MKGIQIRRIGKDEITEAVEIWYEASKEAHSFIPIDYWKANRSTMKYKYLPISETYVAANEQGILGFVSLMENHLAAIFVRPENQGSGIGGLLIDYVKTIRTNLHLRVYSRNKRSIGFYKYKGFSFFSESIDDATGENELIMQWTRNSLLNL